MKTTSLDKSKIKIVLLEGIDPSARDAFEKDGYSDVVSHPKSMTGEALAAALHGAYFVATTRISGPMNAHCGTYL